MSQLLSKLARRILPTQPPPPPLNAKKFVGTEFKAPCTGSLGRAIAKQFFFASHHDALREIVRKQVVLVKQSNGSLLRVHTLKHPVREGQLIQLPQMILKPAPSKSHSDTGISIRYEDANLLIIDKPAGLAMHGGRSIDRAGDTLLPWLARHCPGAKPLHRLDRDATGLVLFAKNADMATRLLHLDPLIDESRIEKTVPCVHVIPWYVVLDRVHRDPRGAPAHRHVDDVRGRGAADDVAGVQAGPPRRPGQARRLPVPRRVGAPPPLAPTGTSCTHFVCRGEARRSPCR